MSSRRPWIYAVGGAVLATAAVVTAMLRRQPARARQLRRAGPAGQSTQSSKPSKGVEPTEDAEPTPTPSEHRASLPTRRRRRSTRSRRTTSARRPRGPGSSASSQSVAAADELAAGLAVLQQGPADPDYETPWAPGSFAGATLEGSDASGVIKVALADSALHDRPAGMTEEYAGAAVQQVVYTLQAAIQARAAVQFTLDGNPIDQVLGVPTSEPLANAPQIDVLALVSITAPEQGAGVSGTLHGHRRRQLQRGQRPVADQQGDKVVKSRLLDRRGLDGQAVPVDERGDRRLRPGARRVHLRRDDRRPLRRRGRRPARSTPRPSPSADRRVVPRSAELSRSRGVR